HAVHFRHAAYQPHHPGADPGPDRAARGQHLAALPEPEAFLRALLLLRAHRLRTRLQNVEPAVLAVAAPFDVHGAPVVLLDDHRVTREFLRLRVRDRKQAALRFRYFQHARGAPRRLVVGEDHAHRLAAEPAPEHRRPPG